MTTRTFVIENTLIEVCKAIDTAESSMREHINTYYHDVNEEFITTLLYGHINYELRKASEKRSIEEGFIKDLTKAVPHNLYERQFQSEFRKNANGLVADIVLHTKSEEGGTKTKPATGGDFGLIILHPQIELSETFSETSIEITENNSSGLLCQAKLQNKKGKWGAFSKSQEKVLPDRMDFTSLVLYSYADENRTELNPIDWKICKGQKFSDIEKSMKADVLRESIRTSEVLKQLGSGQIGTKDNKIIENVISPSVRQSLTIRIYWKNNHPTSGREIVLQRIRQEEKQRIHQFN